VKPNQKMTDSQGNEVALFPLEYLRMSQGEHQLYALDFLGWNASGRVYDCPCYAPFTCRVTFTGNDHNMICQSINKVRFVDGTLDYATVLVAHSMTAPPPIGTIFQQGALWYHTGNYGQFTTGDHLHMEVAKGRVSWATGGLHLNNPYHMWDMLATNDTVISAGMGLDWREYEGGVTPPTPDVKKTKRHFPWVLYARKLRGGL